MFKNNAAREGIQTPLCLVGRETNTRANPNHPDGFRELIAYYVAHQGEMVLFFFIWLIFLLFRIHVLQQVPRCRSIMLLSLSKTDLSKLRGSTGTWKMLEILQIYLIYGNSKTYMQTRPGYYLQPHSERRRTPTDVFMSAH